MAQDNFWTSKGVDPKRKYRFTVSLAGGATYRSSFGAIAPLWFAKTVDKPEITVNTADVNFMQHKFYFPGTVEWNEVSLVLTDPISPDAAGATAALLSAMGYVGPEGAVQNLQSIAKTQSFEVIIKQVDAKGVTQEQWTLKNAFIIKLGYGDLDYTSEDLSEITMTFRYDWAEIITQGEGGPFFNGTNDSDD
jgi:hypothetical protein